MVDGHNEQGYYNNTKDILILSELLEVRTVY